MEIDAEGNYRGKMEKTNVVVSSFGTNLKYIENQMRKGTELPIKKRTSFARDLRATIAQGVNETDSNGDVPSPKTNIPQNGNGVNTIVYEKAVDGSFYVVEAVPDSKYKTLWVETAYMKKEKPSHEPDERFRSPGKTSETNILPTSQTGDVPSPKTNIPQNGNAVNGKEQANFEKAVQKKATGVFAPGAFVQLLKVKELFLAFHFCIALAAINRTILSGFERNFCFAAAGSAGGGVHFFLGFDFVFACIAALFATLGLVNEAALCIEFLFAGGESELFSAFFAH